MDTGNANARAGNPQNRAPAQPLGDTLTVKGQLALLGWKSLRAWCIAHGYDRQMGAYVVRHWGRRTDRQPHGGISRMLMRDLRETLATGRGPERREHAKEA